MNVDWFFISHRLPIALRAINEGYEVHIATKTTNKLNELKDNGKFDNLNSKTEDAAGFFNTEKNKFYFTRCENASAQSIDCFIYVSYLEGGTWSDPQRLNAYINQQGSNSRQASVTVSGDSLFFCSDREGGFGKYDIYLSTKNGSENWGPAQNLGSQINTPSSSKLFIFHFPKFISIPLRPSKRLQHFTGPFHFGLDLR